MIVNIPYKNFNVRLDSKLSFLAYNLQFFFYRTTYTENSLCKKYKIKIDGKVTVN